MAICDARIRAKTLGSVAGIEHARTIARRVSSADQQLGVYGEALGAGAADHGTEMAVIDWPVSEPGCFERQDAFTSSASGEHPG